MLYCYYVFSVAVYMLLAEISNCPVGFGGFDHCINILAHPVEESIHPSSCVWLFSSGPCCLRVKIISLLLLMLFAVDYGLQWYVSNMIIMKFMHAEGF